MTVSTILPDLKKLNRAEKMFLVQYLVAELAQDEFQGLYPHVVYPVWSPFNSFEAASIMLDLLDEKTTKNETLSI